MGNEHRDQDFSKQIEADLLTCDDDSAALQEDHDFLKKLEAELMHHSEGKEEEEGQQLLPSLVPVPTLPSMSPTVETHIFPTPIHRPKTPVTQEHTPPVLCGDKKKRKRWAEEEHLLFLEGINTYGKGDWVNISNHFLPSRTPTQIASHAQKYFIRQNTCDTSKKRKSIHDITLPIFEQVATSHADLNAPSITSNNYLSSQQQNTPSTSSNNYLSSQQENMDGCSISDTNTEEDEYDEYDELLNYLNSLSTLPESENQDTRLSHIMNEGNDNLPQLQIDDDACGGISDIKTEKEEDDELMNYFNSLSPLPNSEIEDTSLSLVGNEENDNLPHLQMDDACGGISMWWDQ